MEVNQAAAEARKQKIRNLEFSLFGEKQKDVSFFYSFQMLQYCQGHTEVLPSLKLREKGLNGPRPNYESIIFYFGGMFGNIERKCVNLYYFVT